MTVKRCYGAFVKKLPLNKKVKDLLIKNQKGSTVGFLFPIVVYLVHLMGIQIKDSIIIQLLITMPTAMINLNLFKNLNLELGYFAGVFNPNLPSYVIAVDLLMLSILYMFIFALVYDYFKSKVRKR